jgi:hypothetical protein
MPGDNSSTVAVGGDVQFPTIGYNTAGIEATGPTTFKLVAVGFYQVFFQVSVDEAGQLLLTLNGAEVYGSCAGRATGTSQISNMVIVQTTTANAILTVRNPTGNSTALTITPSAGGAHAVSAHLCIVKL